MRTGCNDKRHGISTAIRVATAATLVGLLSGCFDAVQGLRLQNGLAEARYAIEIDRYYFDQSRDPAKGRVCGLAIGADTGPIISDRVVECEAVYPAGKIEVGPTHGAGLVTFAEGDPDRVKVIVDPLKLRGELRSRLLGIEGLREDVWVGHDIVVMVFGTSVDSVVGGKLHEGNRVEWTIPVIDIIRGSSVLDLERSAWVTTGGNAHQE